MPQQEARDITVQAIAILLANIVWLFILALVPFVLTILAIVTGVIAGLPAEWVSGLLAGLWSISGLGAVVLFKRHESHWRERMFDLATSMFASDSAVSAVTCPSQQQLDKEHVMKECARALLLGMCLLLEPQVAARRKGATFIILVNGSQPTSFDLFTQVNHQEQHLRNRVRELTLHRSLAGKAIRTGELQMIRDCLHPRSEPSGNDWLSVYDTSPQFRAGQQQFRGRAAVPVRASIKGQLKDIGALCFDITIPLTFTKDDQQILGLYAEKTAALWEVLMAC